MTDMKQEQFSGQMERSLCLWDKSGEQPATQERKQWFCQTHRKSAVMNRLVACQAEWSSRPFAMRHSDQLDIIEGTVDGKFVSVLLVNRIVADKPQNPRRIARKESGRVNRSASLCSNSDWITFLLVDHLNEQFDSYDSSRSCPMASRPDLPGLLP